MKAKGERFCEPRMLTFSDRLDLQLQIDSYGEIFCEQAKNKWGIKGRTRKVSKFVKPADFGNS